jgi:hypothetical protein
VSDEVLFEFLEAKAVVEQARVGLLILAGLDFSERKSGCC